MNAKKTLDALEQACKDLKVRLAYDDLKTEGGLCRLRDSWHLILNRRLSAESRIRIIREALARVTAAGPLSAPEPSALAEPAAFEPAVPVEPAEVESPMLEPEPERAPIPVGASMAG